jgi:hypothetical protein
MPRIRTLLKTLPALALAAAIAAPGAAATTTQDSIFQDDGQLHANPVRTLQTLHNLGVTRIRTEIAWGQIAPANPPKGFQASNPAAYPASSWGASDEIAVLAKQYGISVYFVVAGPAPKWALGPGDPHQSGEPVGVWKPNAAAFGAFVSALGTRYSGHYAPRSGAAPLPRVSFWSIWNEPNYGQDLAPQSSAGGQIQLAAATYRGLLNSAYGALHATGHGSDTILFGETAPHGYVNGGNFSGVAPLEFVRGLYCLNSRLQQLRGSLAAANGCPTTPAASAHFRAQNPGLFAATGFASHPYAQGTPPNRSLHVGGQDNADFADFAALGKLERTLDAANRSYGSGTRFPIYSTEYGFQTNPPEKPAVRTYPLPLDTAAAYMNWCEYLSYKSSRIRSYDQYLLVDPPGGRFASGLEFSNGAAKPGLAAYKLPLFMPRTTAHGGATLEVWGGVRGASSTQAKIQFQPGSRGNFTTLATVRINNARGYFDVRQRFAGAGTVRIAWTASNGKTIYSRSVQLT